MKKYQITKQILNTEKLDLIEAYLKGRETDLNPVIDDSEIVGIFTSEQEAWKALEAYKSVLRPYCRKYRPHSVEEAQKSVIDEDRGTHRLEEYVLECVTYDEDGEASEYNFLGRAEFDGLMIYQLQCISCTAPKNKADWCNGMVTDADAAHVVKDMEHIDWFLSKRDAMEALARYNSYVNEYGEAYEYQVEECIVGDINDNGTWDWGDREIAPYPYVKVVAENNHSYRKRFVDIFVNEDSADYWIDEEWLEDNLFEDEIALHYQNMNGEDIKIVPVESLRNGD